jgi:hypothetical protein
MADICHKHLFGCFGKGMVFYVTGMNASAPARAALLMR